MNISPPSRSIVLLDPDISCYTGSRPAADWLSSSVFGVVFTVFSLTDVVVDVDQLVQEVFDRGHAAEDDGMERRHPLLLPVTQLKAQVPDALQRLATTKTQHHTNTHSSSTSDLQLADRTQCDRLHISKSGIKRVPGGQTRCEALCPAHTWPTARRKSLSSALSEARL